MSDKEKQDNGQAEPTEPSTNDGGEGGITVGGPPAPPPPDDE